MTQPDIYIGRDIGNYHIEQTVASGSFGMVYYARHLHLKQRAVVIKILHSVRLDSNEEREQFLQEAQILETLKGLTNILPLLDVGIDGNVPYMIAEYAEQGSLRTYMRQHGVPLPLRKTQTIIEQVGRGLQNAHDQGIVHRDLKPENILFNAKGEALLADFGLSTVLSTASVKYTEVAGTPAYMAPEQFRGEVCKENDQYALACIAYELLTGRKVFEASDLPSIAYFHACKTPTPPRQLNPQIPASVEHALLKALSKERTERYPSVSAFVTALHNSDNDDERNTQPPVSQPLSLEVLGTSQYSLSSSSSDNAMSQDLVTDPPLVERQSSSSVLPSTPSEMSKFSTLPLPILHNSILLSTEKGHHRGTQSFLSSLIADAPMQPSPPSIAGNETKPTIIIADAPMQLSPPAVVGNETTPTTHNTTSDGTRPLTPTSPRGSGPNWTPTPPRTTPKRNKRTIIILPLALVTLLLLTLLVRWAISANPDTSPSVSHTHSGNSTTPISTPTPTPIPLPATVTITPTSKTVQDTFVMQGVNGNTNPNNNDQVAVRQLSSTQTNTKQVPLTHLHQDAQSATGTITFLNSSTNASTIKQSKTTFQVGNVKIVIDQNAVIPGSNSLQQQQITLSAHAVQPGSAGNIPALTINQSPCCGNSNISAQNLNAFAGGTDAADYNYLKPDDVTAVTNTDQGTLKTNAQNDIKSQMKPSEQLLGDINCDPPKTTEDIQPNTPQANTVTAANVTLSVTCTGKVYDSSIVQTIAQNALKQKASTDPGTGYVQTGNIVTQPQQPQVQQDGNVTFSVIASGVWSYQWTDTMRQDLLNEIKGKSVNDAQAILNSHPGIASVTIALRDGGNILPSDVTQIAFIVRTVNGP
jgi:serine/threonine protein kinase